MKHLSILLATLLVCQSAFGGLNFTDWNTKISKFNTKLGTLAEVETDEKEKVGLEDLEDQLYEIEKYIAEIDQPSILHLVYNGFMPVLTEKPEANYTTLTKEEKLVAKQTMQYEIVKFRENLRTEINKLSVLGRAINYIKANPYRVTIGTASVIAAILAYRNRTDLMAHAHAIGSYIANSRIVTSAYNPLTRFKKPAEQTIEVVTPAVVEGFDPIKSLMNYHE